MLVVPTAHAIEMPDVEWFRPLPPSANEKKNETMREKLPLFSLSSSFFLTPLIKELPIF